MVKSGATSKGGAPVGETLIMDFDKNGKVIDIRSPNEKLLFDQRVRLEDPLTEKDMMSKRVR
jgi:uncharacterized protein YuzE